MPRASAPCPYIMLRLAWPQVVPCTAVHLQPHAHQRPQVRTACVGAGAGCAAAACIHARQRPGPICVGQVRPANRNSGTGMLVRGGGAKVCVLLLCHTHLSLNRGRTILGDSDTHNVRAGPGHSNPGPSLHANLQLKYIDWAKAGQT